MRLPLFLIFITFFQTTICQINWKTANDSINLTPNIIKDKGSVRIVNGRYGGSQTVLLVGGEITVFLKEKKIILKYEENSTPIKQEQINELELESFGKFSNDILFKKEFNDSIVNSYRKNIYKLLDLNLVSVSFSKKQEFEFKDGKLELKNQKVQQGKLCYVDKQSIVILSETGELLRFEDGEFNYITVDRTREYSCKDIFSKLLNNYQLSLERIRKGWVDNIKTQSIEKLVAVLGGIDKVIQISAETRAFTWRKIQTTYKYSSISNSFSSVQRESSSGGLFNQFANLFVSNYSSIFLSGYYQSNTNYSASSETTTTSSTSTRQNAIIESIDQGFELTVIVDSKGKIVDLYELNYFQLPEKVNSFVFVKF